MHIFCQRLIEANRDLGNNFFVCCLINNTVVLVIRIYHDFGYHDCGLMSNADSSFLNKKSYTP